METEEVAMEVQMSKKFVDRRTGMRQNGRDERQLERIFFLSRQIEEPVLAIGGAGCHGRAARKRDLGGMGGPLKAERYLAFYPAETKF